MPNDNPIDDRERRENKRLFHKYRRRTDPSLWGPGVLTVVIAAAVLWLFAEVHKIDYLENQQTGLNERVERVEKALQWMVSHRKGALGIFPTRVAAEEHQLNRGLK